jgi:hypothetical protein
VAVNPTELLQNFKKAFGLPIVTILPHLDALEAKGSTRSTLTTLFSLATFSFLDRHWAWSMKCHYCIRAFGATSSGQASTRFLLPDSAFPALFGASLIEPRIHEKAKAVYIYLFIILYVILHCSDSMRMFRQHVLTVIGKGYHQPSRRPCQNRSAAVVCLEQSHLDLEPWQWKSFTAIMIIKYSVTRYTRLAMPYVYI